MSHLLGAQPLFAPAPPPVTKSLLTLPPLKRIFLTVKASRTSTAPRWP